MKTLIITVILVVGFLSAVSACSRHGLHTQTDVDNLKCIHIAFTVTIEQNTSSLDFITNLDTLSTIITIGEDLIIENNPYLTDISGLSNLASVGRNLIIRNNPVLNECCALDRLLNLGFVGGNIILENNGSGNCNNDGIDVVACAPIPTLTQWGITILSILIIIMGLVSVKQRQRRVHV